MLDAVARAPRPLSLTEIADAAGAPVSSAHDLLDELTALGHLRLVDRRYVLGWRAHTLTVIGGTTRPAGVDHARLGRLSRQCGAPLTLAVLVGDAVHYLDHAGPRAPGRIQAVADDHRPRPALRTAAGRLMLARAENAPRDHVLDALRAEDPTAVAAFDAEIATIRREGIARSDGLADPDIAAIAVGTSDPSVALLLTARRGPRGGRVPHLEAAARSLLTQLSHRP
ncbi:MAG: helix-turn-helix domain-containing protein [Williamsia herbipolensis]|nr:helix-turn-helix domain-containing protein [Williamsia herbipolensis]